mmetsp:Transcript_35732/g.114318  ORF Transcript_35732/g.114318 Transcript_35732/m.114318 type:complete len:383 (+) Transcript_35732:729-1877(+)
MPGVDPSRVRVAASQAASSRVAFWRRKCLMRKGSISKEARPFFFPGVLCLRRIKGRDVGEDEVVAELVAVAEYALVVVDEVAAPVEDELLSIDFDGARVVRGVAVNDVDAGVDEGVGEGPLGARRCVAPIRPPVERHNSEGGIPLLFFFRRRRRRRDELPPDPRRRRGVEVRERVDAGPVRRRLPRLRDPARLVAVGGDPNRRLRVVVSLEFLHFRRVPYVGSRADEGDARLGQRLQRFLEATAAPVEDVVVREDRAVGERSQNLDGVLGMDSVIDSLGRQIVRRRHCRLQIHDHLRRLPLPNLTQGVAPDVLDGPPKPAVRLLGDGDVAPCILHVGLRDRRRARHRERLVDATRHHHVPGQRERPHPSPTARRSPSFTQTP